MEAFIGLITIFGGTYAPRGWAFCNGQLLSVAQNSALFSLLGTTYGGNGQTTFALPDLRGRVPLGMGQGAGLPTYTLGEKAGTPTVTLGLQQMPIHNHPTTVTQTSMMASTSAGTLQVPVTGSLLAQSNQRDAQYVELANAGSTVPLGGAPTASVEVGQVGGSQAFPIMQPYLSLNFIIALEGIYPSRN
ncbi:phage tail protein [Comamonas piscis]|uniref:Phage tail protein n=1 Tax=Comamonas piscis TaxID=1562974 RepID=A0A7G5EC16_9BURK|nr:tail fiber protein [Comamonas piscis]QMV71541.1 phage tail protein [Comamonas piscis]WSO34254.1 tail fiber protein [Comamonas piscis]